MRYLSGTAIGLLTLTVALVNGAEPLTTPRPLPLTRPEVKQYLEDMKTRTPRIPLPDLTEEEKAKLGDRGGGYEGRLRYHYLSTGGDGRTGGGGGGFSREPDKNMSLEYPFKTELFWIVSRTNNCQYCLGHQEWKLAGAGLKESEIAALDGDWSGATPAKRAAYAYARKITLEPHLLSDADFESLRKHYTDMQILEMTLSVAGNNSINRWKEGVGVPQSKEGGSFRRGDNPTPASEPSTFKSFLTPTPAEYKDSISKVAPLIKDEKSGEWSRLAVLRRPALEPREAVEKALTVARERSPRLPLVEEKAAREVLPDYPEGPMPSWVRLLANFPREGKSRISSLRSAEEKGDLKPLLKAQVSWIIARQDRAWYAVGEAKARLNKLGWSDDKVFTLDGDWKDFTPAERSLFTVARKLASSPVVLTDADVKEALERTSPRDVVQVINYTTGRALFDRVTEAAALKVEGR